MREETTDPEEILCARCARQGTTCCQNTRIFLTSGDMERIAAAGMRDFHEVVAMAWPKTSAEDLDPAWRRTFASGVRRVLRRRPNGDCLFLGSAGCALDLSDRPLLCRLYPFDYDGNGIKGIHAHYCPYPENENAPLLLALLRMNRTEAEEWRAQFYREIIAEFPPEP